MMPMLTLCYAIYKRNLKRLENYEITPAYYFFSDDTSSLILILILSLHPEPSSFISGGTEHLRRHNKQSKGTSIPVLEPLQAHTLHSLHLKANGLASLAHLTAHKVLFARLGRKRSSLLAVGRDDDLGVRRRGRERVVSSDEHAFLRDGEVGVAHLAGERGGDVECSGDGAVGRDVAEVAVYAVGLEEVGVFEGGVGEVERALGRAGVLAVDGCSAGWRSGRGG
jgi:hypothetical protein